MGERIESSMLDLMCKSDKKHSDLIAKFSLQAIDAQRKLKQSEEMRVNLKRKLEETEADLRKVKRAREDLEKQYKTLEITLAKLRKNQKEVKDMVNQHF